MQPDLSLAPEHLDQIIRHIESCLPEEACGLIGGTNRHARLVIPVENELHSRVLFRMAPLAQLKALDQIEILGFDLLAIFHSHPQGPAAPSPTDIAEFFYPGTAVIIAAPADRGNLNRRPRSGLDGGNWRVNAFVIDQNQVHPVKLTLAA